MKPFSHSSIQATLLGRAGRVKRKGRRSEKRKREVQFSKQREQEIKNKGCGYFSIFGAKISKLSAEISITKIKNKNKISASFSIFILYLLTVIFAGSST